METQTYIFKKEKFKNKSSVKSWLKKNEVQYKKIHETSTSFRARVKSPEKFKKDSFRTKEISDGVSIVIGKLKEHLEESFVDRLFSLIENYNKNTFMEIEFVESIELRNISIKYIYNDDANVEINLKLNLKDSSEVKNLLDDTESNEYEAIRDEIREFFSIVVKEDMDFYDFDVSVSRKLDAVDIEITMGSPSWLDRIVENEIQKEIQPLLKLVK